METDGCEVLVERLRGEPWPWTTLWAMALLCTVCNDCAPTTCRLSVVCEVPNRRVSAVVVFELLLQLCEHLSELINITGGKLFVSTGWQFQQLL